ncbi:MAG: glycine--tRNA ligase subunit beta [Desulfobacterales bacterium]|nr:glycine--tRNA ligase subunit beta [Desulfobacterales bacterium]
MLGELLLEIGTEEIPSDYLKGALDELKRLAAACLKEKRIEITGGLFTYGTPRRLVLIGKIATKQEDLVQEVTGPPKNVSYDEEGKPTKAALGFAQKQGVPVEDLECVETSKGEYLYIKRRIPGEPTPDILSDVLPKVITDIPWPKSMRWGDLGFTFARPIHWIMALFNGEIIPFNLAGVKTGNTTSCHRFMGPQAIKISNVQDYLKEMERGFVLIDQAERERAVEKASKEAARTVGGVTGHDPDLIKTVANLVEYPSAVCGGFDQAFLDLPDAVLISSMKKHQRYFAVYDDKGQLMPHFVAVNNTSTKDGSMVRKGHERVLRARLSDADFFFKEDRKRALEDRIEDLKGVIYQADLGTSYAKITRFAKLAEYLAKIVLPDELDNVCSAARLCKCDLITHMVTEFPGLQGIMGKEYARLEGYPEEVCQAINEHYFPTRAGGQLPTSKIGALVGLADRMDTIAGCFAIGLKPSGNADPFALRRHALSIIRIIEEMGWGLSLREFIGKALSILREEIRFEIEQVFTEIKGFFRERYKQMMLRSGHESDLIEAIISVSFDHIHQLRQRIEQLKRFSSESAEFQALTLTFKRVSNILKKQKNPYEVDAGLFKETCESTLWKTYQALKDDVRLCLDKKDYYKALNLMARFREPVDEFFDGVEVLTKDKSLRENRVGLLQNLSRFFLKVADFSKFSI